MKDNQEMAHDYGSFGLFGKASLQAYTHKTCNWKYTT